MDIQQLYRDYNITFVTEGHRHTSPGWVHTPCPFCTGNPGYHLGYDTNLDRFVCWRCGGHWPNKAVAGVLNVSISEANKILRQYGVLTGKTPQMARKPKIHAFKLPSNITELQNNHITYLINRNYDVDEIKRIWNVEGTGIVSTLDSINYKFRLFIPFFVGSQMVTFDTRTIAKNSTAKYIACPENRELIPRKSILYGLEQHWTDTIILVEGCTDVWRMGVHSAAVSGIKYTSKQLRLIAKRFKRVAVLFDPDPQAIIQANKLVADLRFRGVDAFRIDIDSDPGDLEQSEADYIVKQIIK